MNITNKRIEFSNKLISNLTLLLPISPFIFLQTNPIPAYSATPQSPQSPNTPLTPKLTGTTTSGPQFFEQGAAHGTPHYGLELFMASEASAVVGHTKQ